MIRRVGRPGLVGTMARTAVIAGTAQAVQGNVARRQQGRWAAQEQQAQAEAAEQAAMQAQLAQIQAQQAQPAPAPPAAAGGSDDLLDQLQRLADLKAAGVLDDAEFAAAKAKLLGA
jgi:hypothetical protein